MKIKIILSILIALFVAVSVQAQAIDGFPSGFPMIASPAALKAYTINAAKRGSSSVYNNAQLGNQTDISYKNSEKGNLDDILADLQSTVFNFQVFKADQLNGWVSVYDKDWNTLFYGGTSLDVRKILGGYLIVPGQKAEIRMNYYIAIPVGNNVSFAQLQKRDADGNIEWYDNIEVANGYMYFKAVYAEQGGYLILEGNDKNGSHVSQAYDLKGVAIKSETVTGSVGIGLINYQTTSDSGYGIGAAVYIANFANNDNKTNDSEPPVSKLVLTSTRTVFVYGWVWDNNTRRFPTVGYWSSASNLNVRNQFPVYNNSWSQLTLPAGTYYFTWDYPNDFKPVPTAPYYGGIGKG